MSLLPIQSYPSPPAVEGVPHAFVGAPARGFSGIARTVNRSVAASSGSSVGASSSLLFQVGTSASSGFVVPSSVQLRFKLVVTQTNGAAGTGWAFAPAFTVNSATGAAGVPIASALPQGAGSAHSLFNRVNLQVGSTQIAYNQWGRFMAIMSQHCSSPEFSVNDFREAALGGGAFKPNVTASTNNTTVYLSVPLMIPELCADTALPLFMLNNAPLQIELYTAAIADAFASVTNAVTNYAISDAYLDFMEAIPSPEYAAAIRAAAAERGGYSLAVNSWMSAGTYSQSGTTAAVIGANLSSAKAVLMASCLAAGWTASAGSIHAFEPNGLVQLQILADGEAVSPPQLGTTQLSCFQSLQQAMQTLSDSNAVSLLQPVALIDTLSYRSAYGNGAFVAGCPLGYQDFNVALTGRPIQNLTINYVTGTPTQPEWQATTGAAAATLFPFIVFAAVLQIGADGSVIYRR